MPVMLGFSLASSKWTRGEAPVSTASPIRRDPSPEQAAEAYQYLQSGSHFGKVVIRVGG
jgi:hypothetical protein